MSNNITVRTLTQQILFDHRSSSVAVVNAGPIGPGGPQGIQGNKGDKGDPGPPLNMKGTVANSAALPSSGNTIGDSYQTLDTGNAWAWNGTAWINTGPYRGPQGLKGDKGDQGDPGPPGTGTAFANNATTILGTATLESVTPASLRASQTRLDVRSFGVVGDGVANDTAALQSALSSGKPIIVPKGFTVKTLAQLSIPSGLDLVIDGRIQRAWNGGAMFLGGSVNPTLVPINNVKIRGTGSVGAESLTVGSGQIFSGGFNDSVFEGITVDTYWGGQAFIVAGDRLRMNRVTVKNSAVAAGTGGIRYYSGTDFVATGCHVECGDDCIQFVPREGFTDPDIRRGAYIGCSGFSTMGRFIAVISAGTSPADIEDCSFIGCHGRASGRGIIVDVIENATGSVRRISIRDCSVDMTNDTTELRGAIYIVDESTSPTAELRDVKLENVTILNPASQAVSVETANFVSFEGCVIEPERNPFTYQFHVNNADDFSMRNCIIGGTGTSSTLRIAGLSERAKIENNTFPTVGVGYGILVFDAIDAIISGNKLTSKVGVTATAGLRVESAAIGTRIERNDFTGVTSSLGHVSVAFGGKVAFRENKGIDYLNPQAGTAYTIKATDNRRLIQMTNVGTKEVTFRLDTQETLPVGEFLDVWNAGDGLLTLVPVSGVVINGSLTVSQGMIARVTKTATNTYLASVVGSGVGSEVVFASNNATILGSSTNSAVTPASLDSSLSRKDVRSFGVVGDGIVDDTTALQSAISSGKPITVPKGLLVKVMAQLIIPNNLDMLIDGRIQRSWNGGGSGATGAMFYTGVSTTASNVRITGTGSVGAESQTVGSGQIFNGDYADSIISYITVNNYWDGQAFVVSGDRLTFIGVTIKGSAVTAGTGGIRYIGGDDFKALGCHVESGDDCLQFVPSETVTARSIRRGAYVGCTGFSTAGRFIAVANGGVGVSNIQDCTFIDCHGKASLRGVVIGTTENATGVTERIALRDCTIDMTNDIQTVAIGAINVYNLSAQPTAAVRDITFDNVSLLNPSKCAIDMTNVQRVTYNNCKFEPDRNTNAQYIRAIAGTGTLEDIVFTDCKIRGTGTGAGTTTVITFEGVNRSRIENCRIIGIGSGVTHGVLINGGSSNIIRGNKFANVAGSVTNGIRVQGAATETLIERNDLSTLTATDLISTAAGTSAYVIENAGYPAVFVNDANLTILPRHSRRTVNIGGTTARIITLQDETGASLMLGEWVNVWNTSTQIHTIVPAGTVTTTGSLSIPVGAKVRIAKVGTNTYSIELLSEITVSANVASEYPPTTRVDGQIWTIPSMGHSAQWVGSTQSYYPIVPSDPELNLCCILNSFTLLLDSASYTSGVWQNKGLGGLTLDATLTGAVLGTDGAGRKYIDFDGVDDYVDIPTTGGWSSFSPTDSFTVLAIKETMIDNTGDQAVMANRNNFGTSVLGGFVLARHATDLHSLRFGDGTVFSAASGSVTDPLGVRLMIIGERNVTADNVTTWINEIAGTPVTDNTTATITGGAFRIGRNSTGGTYHAMRGYVFGVARRVFTTAEKYVLDDWRQKRFS